MILPRPHFTFVVSVVSTYARFKFRRLERVRWRGMGRRRLLVTVSFAVVFVADGRPSRSRRLFELESVIVVVRSIGRLSREERTVVVDVEDKRVVVGGDNIECLDLVANWRRCGCALSPDVRVFEYAQVHAFPAPF